MLVAKVIYLSNQTHQTNKFWEKQKIFSKYKET